MADSGVAIEGEGGEDESRHELSEGLEKQVESTQETAENPRPGQEFANREREREQDDGVDDYETQDVDEDAVIILLAPSREGPVPISKYWNERRKHWRRPAQSHREKKEKYKDLQGWKKLPKIFPNKLHIHSISSKIPLPLFFCLFPP